MNKLKTKALYQELEPYPGTKRRIRILGTLVSGLFLALAIACGPKVIEETESNGPVPSSGIFSNSSSSSNSSSGSDPGSSSGFAAQVHKVFVHEVLPTEKYVYLHVDEGGEHFWIATRKQDVRLGGTYYYRDGLLKTNFESKEYKRVFDKIYLVSNLVAEDHAGGSKLPQNTANTPGTPAPANGSSPASESWSGAAKKSAGSISVAELVSNPQKYEGQTVQLSGKCVKINPNIMNRNWIHLQDGSRDDFDLVITSNKFVAEGESITIQAVVSLNKDFGAGYKYGLILENGALVP